MPLNPSSLAKSLALLKDLVGRQTQDNGEPRLLAQLRELEGLLQSAWEEMLEQTLKLVELRKLNLKYKQQLRLGREMIYDGSAYWFKAAGENKQDGPLCPTCWEVEDKVVHLTRLAGGPGKSRAHAGWEEWECKRCREVFLRRTGRAAPVEPPQG